MNAVILAGGKGERLRPLTGNNKKAFLPLGDKRLIDHVVDKIPAGTKIEISVDDTGAISALSNAIKEIQPADQPLMVICGDNYFTQKLDSFVSEYVGCTQIGVYDIKSLEKAKNYGVVKFDKWATRIISFTEKPESPDSTIVSMGIYIFPPSVFEFIHEMAEDNPKGNLGDVIRRLLDFEIVYGHFFGGRWIDIGTMESYQLAQEYVRSERPEHTHTLMLQCDGIEDIAYCVTCGLATPPQPCNEAADAEDMFKEAEEEGTLYYNDNLKGKGIPGIIMENGIGE